MADSSSNTTTPSSTQQPAWATPASQQSGGFDLTGILTALQQGVQAINNTTQVVKAIFP